MEYKVLGVSSGIGVSLYPFKEECIGNIEARAIFHTKGDKQWKANFQNIPLWKDPTSVWSQDIEGVDVMIGSPDCGSGSILRYSRSKKLGNHRDNDSLSLFIRMVNEYRPKLFLFENLEGLFKSIPQEEFEAEFPGYRLIIHVNSVAYWGNSQIHRKRLVVVGIRKDLPKKLRKYFRLPDYRLKNKTCEELYGDLDYVFGDPAKWVGHVREAREEMITMYSGKKMKILEVTKEWKNRLHKKKRWTVFDRKFTTAPGVYRNLRKSYPATARKANRQFDHNGFMLTPRQLARIQGIPDDFRIVIDTDRLNYWINKARAAVTKTPPYEISEWFKQKLDKSIKLWLQPKKC